MKADELIARLAAEGEYEGDGSFTLDPTVALDKLREYQLRDPNRFVLSWMRAAVLLGASRIDIEIDADDAWFRFDGDLLEPGDFDVLWTTVVGAAGSWRVRACRELALGINGAFSWDAKAVTIQSGTLEVRFDREFQMRRATVEPASTANVVHAKRSLGWDIFGRTLRDLDNELDEELLLARACAHASPLIYLEGRRLNPESSLAAKPWRHVDIDDDHRRGYVQLRSRERSQLRVLKAGVEVTLIDLPVPHGFIHALVDDPLLPLDLSQERPVEGPRWHELLACVARARWQAWFSFAGQLGWPAEPHLRSEGEKALLRDLFASPDARWIEAPGAMSYANALQLERAATDAHAGFRQLERFGPCDPPTPPFAAPAPTPLTLGDLVRHARTTGRVFISRAELANLPHVPEVPVAQLEPTPMLRALGAVELDREANYHHYFKAIHQVRSLSQGRALGDGWVGLEHRHEQLRIRLAWNRRAEVDTAGMLIVGREGKRLAEFCLPRSWGPLWAEVEGPFETRPEVPLDRQLATAVLAVLERYHDLVAMLSPVPRHQARLVCAYLRSAWGSWSARRLAELGQIPKDERIWAVTTWFGGGGVPPQWRAPEAGERGPCDHPIMDLAWLDRHGTASLSLRDVQRELARGPLEWIDRYDPTAPLLPPEIWRLSADEHALVFELFADTGRIARFDEHAFRRRGTGSNVVPAQLDGAHLSLSFTGDAGERGILALPIDTAPGAWKRPPRREARLRLLARGHDLGWLDVLLPTGPFYGVIEVPEARAVAHADLALKDDAWHAAAKLVEQTARRLAQLQLDEWMAADARFGREDRARIFAWCVDLREGNWTELGSTLIDWRARLPTAHPLNVSP